MKLRKIINLDEFPKRVFKNLGKDRASFIHDVVDSVVFGNEEQKLKPPLQQVHTTVIGIDPNEGFIETIETHSLMSRFDDITYEYALNRYFQEACDTMALSASRGLFHNPKKNFRCTFEGGSVRADVYEVTQKLTFS